MRNLPGRTAASQRGTPGWVVAKTILIADDNAVIRKILCQVFEHEEDYDICAEAVNGQEAIELALKHKPDLIILELSMPVMNGLDAARQLKRIMRSTPIILFSQYADLSSRIGFTNLNVDRIVSKEDASSLMGHVRSLAPAW
jgi:DNA-binding NarL/FixJ family response regulator